MNLNPNHKVNKTPRNQIKSELITKKRALNRLAAGYLPGTPEQEKLTEDEIKNTKTLFNLNGNAPHIIDAINGICTHKKELIRNTNENTLYYECTIDLKNFFYYALGAWGNSSNKKELLKEMNKTKNGCNIALFYDNQKYLVYKPVLFPGFEYAEPTSKQNAIGGRITTKITILFLKHIWESLVEYERGANFIYTPFALSSAMKYIINKYYNILQIREHKNFRKFLLYLLRNDYSTEKEIIFDPVEMCYFCYNRPLRDIEYNKFRKGEAWEFVEKGIKLFLYMQKENFLYGLKIKSENNFKILSDGRFKISLEEPINVRFKSERNRFKKPVARLPP